MPYAVRKPCPWKHGPRPCSRLIDSHEKYCAEHRKADDKLRPNSTDRGYGHKWRKLRLRILDRDGSICQHCVKETPSIYTPASHVDHRIPTQGPDDPNHWDESNLQSLCAKHHMEKTATQDGGFGNPKQAPQPLSKPVANRIYTSADFLRERAEMNRKAKAEEETEAK